MIDMPEESPLECCGILSGKDGTVKRAFDQNAEKVHPVFDLSIRTIEVFERWKRESLEMIAVYHSHTHTIPFPSETDVKLAFTGYSSVIISLKDEKDPDVKAFQISKRLSILRSRWYEF
jgi:proteasome lid subunit RPN8/RPN11